MVYYRLVLPLYIDIIKILYMSMTFYACSMALLPVLVYWCGAITAPYSGLACVLQRFGSFPVNPCGHRYIWKRRRVYGDFFINDSVLGEATYSFGQALRLAVSSYEPNYKAPIQYSVTAISLTWVSNMPALTSDGNVKSDDALDGT